MKEPERTPERLACYRPDEKAYRGLAMTPEERAERRAYMRRKLQGTAFANLPSAELDASAYYEIGGRGVYEDSEYRCYVLAAAVQGEDAEFRKVRAMIPFEYIGMKAKDFDWDVYGADMSSTKRVLNNYLTGFEVMRSGGLGLYIYSCTKGSGKTLLSCCILNEIAERYAVSAKFVNVLDLLEMTSKGYDGEKADIEGMYEAAVLVLDDIGVQMRREWTDTVFYQLINRRYSEHKVTIYTSNMPIDSLRMDDRITDRIESSSYIITLPEVSVRRMKSNAKKDRIMQEIKNPRRG